MIVQGVFTIPTLPSLLAGDLVDTDTYMHLVRAEELWRGESFFDPVIERSNVPYGETQHWTRLYDLILIAVAVPFSPLGVDSALNIAALAIGPIMLILLLVALEWATRPLRGSSDWPLVVIVGVSQAAVLAYAAVGRADHHVLIFLLMTIAIGLLVRMLSDPRRSAREVWFGLTLAAGLWVSTEFEVVIGVCLISLIAAWVTHGRQFAALLERASFSWLVGVGLALLLERGPAWQTVEYDRISVVHLALAGAAFVTMAGASRIVPRAGMLGRAAAIAAIGLATAVAVWMAFPNVLGGPWAEIDPLISEIWLERVAELQPMLPTSINGVGVAILYLGAPVLGFLVGLSALTRAKSGWGLPALPVLLGGAVFLILALRYSRFAPHAEILGVFPLLWGIDSVLNNAEIRPKVIRSLTRVGVIGAAAAGFLIVGSAISGYGTEDAVPSSGESCSVRELADFLNEPSPGNTQLTILANIDFGSELLYRTDHRVIGTPIRQQDAILDTYTALTTSEPGEARDIITRRHVDRVLLCPSHDDYMFGDPPPTGSLDDRLLKGEIPYWLRPVDLPAHLSGFRMFAVQA